MKTLVIEPISKALSGPSGRAPSPALPEGKVTANGRQLSNEYLDVRLTDDGSLSLRRRDSGREFAGLFGIETEPDLGDTYSFAPGQGRPVRSRARVTAQVLASGPLVAVLEARWEDLDASFRLHVELRSGEPFVRLSLTLENRGTDRRLRARFPTGLQGGGVIAGAAFGSERRGHAVPVRNSPAETPVTTAPAHRYVGAAGARGGLALLVPGHCEYEWMKGGDLLLTLLRSVGQLSRDDLFTRPGHAGWPTPTPEAQFIGADRVTFALAPLPSRDITTDRLHALWEAAFLPPSARWLRDPGKLRMPTASIELAGAGLVLSAVKPAEDGSGIVLRCWNAADETVQGAWKVAPIPSAAWLTRADEEGADPLAIEKGGAIPFTAAPGTLVTIRIT